MNIVGVNSEDGTVVINEDGNIDFAPNANLNGTLTFNYTVSDGTKSSTASAAVTVNSVNDLPVLISPIPDLPV